MTAAEQAGVTTLAMTDHDTVAGYLEWSEQAGDTSLAVVPGIEFSTIWNGVGVHIVGLNIEPHSDAIRAGTESQLNARRARTSRIVERLNKAGLLVDEDALLANCGNAAPGRPHIAQHLVERGLVKDTATAFKKYLGAGKAGDVKNLWAELQTVIEWIRDGGGTAVLAHPDKYSLTFAKLGRLCGDFKQLGGQAIEVISGLQTEVATHRLCKLAEEHNLLASLGSDFHQPGQSWARLGQPSALPGDCTPVWQHW